MFTEEKLYFFFQCSDSMIESLGAGKLTYRNTKTLALSSVPASPRKKNAFHSRIFMDIGSSDMYHKFNIIKIVLLPKTVCE